MILKLPVKKPMIGYHLEMKAFKVQISIPLQQNICQTLFVASIEMHVISCEGEFWNVRSQQ